MNNKIKLDEMITLGTMKVITLNTCNNIFRIHQQLARLKKCYTFQHFHFMFAKKRA